MNPCLSVSHSALLRDSRSRRIIRSHLRRAAVSADVIIHWATRLFESEIDEILTLHERNVQLVERPAGEQLARSGRVYHRGEWRRPRGSNAPSCKTAPASRCASEALTLPLRKVVAVSPVQLRGDEVTGEEARLNGVAARELALQRAGDLPLLQGQSDMMDYPMRVNCRRGVEADIARNAAAIRADSFALGEAARSPLPNRRAGDDALFRTLIPPIARLTLSWLKGAEQRAGSRRSFSATDAEVAYLAGRLTWVLDELELEETSRMVPLVLSARTHQFVREREGKARGHGLTSCALTLVAAEQRALSSVLSDLASAAALGVGSHSAAAGADDHVSGASDDAARLLLKGAGKTKPRSTSLGSLNSKQWGRRAARARNLARRSDRVLRHAQLLCSVSAGSVSAGAGSPARCPSGAPNSDESPWVGSCSVVVGTMLTYWNGRERRREERLAALIERWESRLLADAQRNEPVREQRRLHAYLTEDVFAPFIE